MSDPSEGSAAMPGLPGAFREAFEAAGKQASSAARKPSDALNETAGRLTKAGCDAVAAVTDLVKANPMAAACFVLGVGYIFGASRRRGRR